MMQRTCSVVLGLLLSLVCSAPLAWGSMYYVSTNGSDSASCSQAQSAGSAKRTINAGIAWTSGGICAGIYGYA